MSRGLRANPLPSIPLVVGETLARRNAGVGYTLLNSVTVGAVTQNLADFQFIPAQFRNLRVVWAGASGAGSTLFRNIVMRFNNDSGSNYHAQRVEDGVSTQVLNATFSLPGRINGAVVGHQTWGAVDIFNYAGTTHSKGIVGVSGYIQAGNIVNMTVSDIWLPTAAAVNRVTLVSDSAAALFAPGSAAYLYGY